MNSRPLISRPRYLHILHTAVTVRQYRFARLAALDWLAAYPGDLSAGLYYARALAGENRPAQAASVLEGLVRADPEYLEALADLVAIQESTAAAADVSVPTHLFALTGRSHNRRNLSTWGGSLWLARQALAQGKLDLAEEMLREALHQAPHEPLVQIVHLALLRRGARLDPQTGREIALRYSQTSPDCLACMLHLAAWSLEAGVEDEAVALLHQVAARDVGGQVAVRMWGENHPYRVLWPERMQIDLRLSIPAEVSVALGWNRLPANASNAAASTHAGRDPFPADLEPLPPPAKPLGLLDVPPVADRSEAVSTADISGLQLPRPAPEDPEATRPTRVRRLDPELAPVTPGAPAASAQPTQDLYWALATEDAGADLWDASGTTAAVAKDRLSALVGAERKPRRSARKNLDPELRSVSQEMDKLAQRLKLPVHGHLDGRFPVYVIFSLRRRLEEHYGAGVAALLESEMGALAAAVGKRRGWASLLLLADDPAGLASLGLSPVRSGDPWELKLLLADLDEALRRRGQCIGALLIVGGPEIVPFHCLPNPVDDPDVEVLSDNPYATPNENYFIPEWPVGRLPGGGRDARLLLDCLNRIRLAHEIAVQRPSRMQRLLEWLRGWFARRPHARRAYGYTAAVWKDASRQVFRPIGRSGGLHVSPPLGYDGADADVVAHAAAHAEKIPPLAGRRGYFNLHGIADGPEWYGQRDPLDPQPGPDLPVALTPQDVLGAAGKNQPLPRVIFSQACYGLPTQPCETGQSMALSFLHGGCLAVVGATGMSYGAVNSNLAAGDLLALEFWRELQRGASAGEALRQAKLRLLAERDASQGYLDGEEQKTLISFALYGDPLALPQSAEHLPKSLRYQDSPLLEVPTICDRALAPDAAVPLPPEVVASVRSVVSHYLPGMSDARVSYARQRETCDGQGHICPTSTLEHEALPAQPAAEKRSPARTVRQKVKHHLHSKNGSGAALKCSTVTLSNCVELAGECHPQVARLTLDEKGKLVKLVVSR